MSDDSTTIPVASDESTSNPVTPAESTTPPVASEASTTNPARPLPAHPDLEFYRKQARALLKTARAGDTAALQRIAQYLLPSRQQPITSATVVLNDAHRAIAREFGFANWNKFRTFVQMAAAGKQSFPYEFVKAAVEDLEAAKSILAEHSEAAQSGLASALVLGDIDTVRRLLPMTSESLREPLGPLSWQPLLYVCFSRFGSPGADRRKAVTKLGALLLKSGADPNAFYLYEDWPLPCLFGATGLNNNPELATALIDAGAKLDDNESLYHSTEHADKKSMKLLLDRGANPSSTNVLLHVLDREDIEALRLLLDAGSDVRITHPTRHETALHWAVWRGRGPEIVQELVTRGADLNALRTDGRSAYGLAYRSGQRDIADYLASMGADTKLLPVDRLVGDCATATEEELAVLAADFHTLRDDPEAVRVFPDLAMSHHTAAVKALLRAGADVDAAGESGATALHWVCWQGFSDIAPMLLEAGASLTAEDNDFHGTPIGWFVHGIKFCPDRSGDWLGVARAMADAGVDLSDIKVPTGDPRIDAFLLDLRGSNIEVEAT